MTESSAHTEKKKKPAKKKGGNVGWVPDQHGAWVMVIIPLVVGISVARPALIHLPLAVAWFVGYFAFFAAGLWMKARGPRKQRYVAPLVTYGVICVIASAVVVAMRPTILVFALVFGPLVAVAVWEAWNRRPRSLVSGESTVLASCAMIPVTAWAAGDPMTTRLWVSTAVIALYFCGTIPYVKTLIRKRGDRTWFIGSVAYHLAAAATVTVLAATGLVTWLAVPVFLVVALRAWWMPRQAGRRGTPWRPRTVGFGEMAVTVLVLVAALVPPVAV
ncbi:YwiC-like family protein [Corynebacterium sp. TAE3-ERU16]|uniref:YwiC-like family protein n=1 Tax=Corynebacterium sp. TAE3-ERU16 TaxID=2849493 RepID=UPI001C49058F|nr:YwiC-like family protein [Corynebacterium sp. TAE3-ERU16]MBV7292436.1 YwiC-like family protein [Corynebacterium sp. TAE3-ERU16]